MLLLQFLLPKQSNGQNTFARRLNLNIIDLVSISPLEDSTILITSFDPLNPGITEIIKYDKMNGSIWSKTIQFQDSITIHQTFDQITTKDNNYIFFAWQGNDHCSIIKYDSSANVIWAESIASGWSRNAFFSPTQDSGFVMTLKLDSVVGQNYFYLGLNNFHDRNLINQVMILFEYTKTL